MKKSGLIPLLASLALGVVFAVSPVLAAEQQVGAAVGKPLQEAQALAQSKDFKKAMAKVREAAAIPDKTPAEEKAVNQFTAYVAMNSGDYAAAAAAYERALQQGMVAPVEKAQYLRLAMQLNYQIKDYAKADRFGTEYIKQYGSTPEIIQLIAQSKYLRGDYMGTEALLKPLVEAATKPQEEWLTLRLSALHQLKRKDDAKATLMLLVSGYPSDVHWNNLFAYLLGEQNLSDRRMLEILRLKDQTVGLAAHEYMEMAELALSLGQYGDALTVLEKGLQTGGLGEAEDAGRARRLLALAKSESATDRAQLAELAAEAAAAKTGEPAVRVGEAFMNYAEYDKALDLIEAGLAKGSLAAADEARLHQGVALLKLGRATEAEAAFNAIPASSMLHRLGQLWMIRSGKAVTRQVGQR